MNNDQLDAHLDAILKAGGSALRHYTTQKSKDDMRAALLLAVLALQSQPAAHSCVYLAVPMVPGDTLGPQDAACATCGQSPRVLGAFQNDGFRSMNHDIGSGLGGDGWINTAAMDDEARARARTGQRPMTNVEKPATVTCGNGCACLTQCGDAYANAGLPQPAAAGVSDVIVGRLPTMNQDPYPSLGDWWVQLWDGSGDDAKVIARAYGSTPQEAHERASMIARAILALRPQAVPMTEADLLACVVKANCLGGVPLSNRNGHYHIDTPSDAVVRLKDAIEAHHGITAQGAQGGEGK